MGSIQLGSAKIKTLTITSLHIASASHLRTRGLSPLLADVPTCVLTFVATAILTKPLIALFLGASVTFAIFSLLPAHTPMYILPKKMLEKGKDHSEEDFRLGIIKNRDGTIQRLQSLSSRKASRLKHALMTLGGAALLTVFDMLTNVNMQLL